MLGDSSFRESLFATLTRGLNETALLERVVDLSRDSDLDLRRMDGEWVSRCLSPYWRLGQDELTPGPSDPELARVLSSFDPDCVVFSRPEHALLDVIALDLSLLFDEGGIVWARQFARVVRGLNAWDASELTVIAECMPLYGLLDSSNEVLQVCAIRTGRCALLLSLLCKASEIAEAELLDEQTNRPRHLRPYELNDVAMVWPTTLAKHVEQEVQLHLIPRLREWAAAVS